LDRSPREVTDLAGEAIALPTFAGTGNQCKRFVDRVIVLFDRSGTRHK
jgi:hypothetical protein